MNEKVKLSLVMDKIETSVTFDYIDVTIDELFSAFKGILITQAFTENQINNCIAELNSEFNHGKV